MNQLTGILQSFESQGEIIRLEVLCQKETLYLLLLEEKENITPLLQKPITLGFKENNVILGFNLRGPRNCFCGHIKKIQNDKLFSHITLWCEDLGVIIAALVFRDFANTLKIGDRLEWCVLESEIMLLPQNSS